MIGSYNVDLRGVMGEIKRQPAAARRSTVFSRIIRPDRHDLTPEAAQSILELNFEDQDLRRMHDLAIRNQAKSLTTDERDELADFRQAGLVLDLLKSKARLSLKTRRDRHGL